MRGEREGCAVLCLHSSAGSLPHLAGLPVRRGSPAGWAALRPPKPCPHLRPLSRQKGCTPFLAVGRATSSRTPVEMRGRRGATCLCVCVCVCISTILPDSPPSGRFSPWRLPPGATLPACSLPGTSRSVAPCTWQKLPEQPSNLHTVEGACEE